jgi:hypothetical protein
MNKPAYKDTLSYFVYLTVIVLLLFGCATTEEKIVIPPVSDPFGQKSKDSEVTLSFRQDKGRLMTQTVEAEGRYTGGEDASPSEVRAKAIQAMVNRAVDLVNGQLISNTIDIRQAAYGSGEIEETRQNVISQTVGLGRLETEPDCQLTRSSDVTITMICKGSVSVPLIDEVKVLRKSNGYVQ